MSTAERDFWDGRASDVTTARRAIWDEEEPNAVRVARMVHQIAPALEPALFDGARVLDLGCGVGDLTRALAIRFLTARFIGVDISPTMLSHARALHGSAARWVLGNGRTLPRVGRLNAAYSALTFQHIPAEAQQGYVREVADRLEPGGVFRFQFVTCPDAAFLSNGASEEQVRVWCEEAGLKVDTVDRDDWCETWAWCTAVRP